MAGRTTDPKQNVDQWRAEQRGIASQADLQRERRATARVASVGDTPYDIPGNLNVGESLTWGGGGSMDFTLNEDDTFYVQALGQGLSTVFFAWLYASGWLKFVAYDAAPLPFLEIDPQNAALNILNSGVINFKDFVGATKATLDADTGDFTTTGNFGAADLTATDDLFVGDDSNLGTDNTDITTVNGHLKHKSTAPSIAAGTALGTGGAATKATIVGSDQAGQVTLTAGTTTLVNGVAATITFADARPNTNYAIILTPQNSAAGTNAIQVRVSASSTSTWQITFGAAPTSGTVYSWFYTIVEWTN